MENINTEKCDLCSGEGYVLGRMTVKNLGTIDYTYGGMKIKVPGLEEMKTYENILCPKCNGTGKIDWVSRITDSRSDEIPELEELTKTVRDLMENDDIFGAEEITIEDHRRRMLKRLERETRYENK